jgi:hypothetical protein
VPGATITLVTEATTESCGPSSSEQRLARARGPCRPTIIEHMFDFVVQRGSRNCHVTVLASPHHRMEWQGQMKYMHEFRDPVHNFIEVTSHERSILDAQPVQRLRHSTSWRLRTSSTQVRHISGSSTVSASCTSLVRRSTS